MVEKLISPAVIYKKFSTGEMVTDEEIAFGIKHFGKLTEMLRQSGNEFSITASECGRIVNLLKKYMWERNQ